MRVDSTVFPALVCSLLVNLPAKGQQDPAEPGSTPPVRDPTGPTGAQTEVPIQPGPAVAGDPAEVNPYGGDEEAIQEGQRLYDWYNCSGCHAPKGGGGMGPPLSTGQWIYGGEPVSLFQSIWEGRPDGMPAWAGQIPPDEVWRIIAYLETLPGDEPNFAPQDQ